MSTQAKTVAEAAKQFSHRNIEVWASYYINETAPVAPMVDFMRIVTRDPDLWEHISPSFGLTAMRRAKQEGDFASAAEIIRLAAPTSLMLRASPAFVADIAIKLAQRAASPPASADAEGDRRLCLERLDEMTQSINRDSLKQHQAAVFDGVQQVDPQMAHRLKAQFT